MFLRQAWSEVLLTDNHIDHQTTTPTRFQPTIMNHNTRLSNRLAFHTDKMKISAVSLASRASHVQGLTDALCITDLTESSFHFVKYGSD